MFALRTSTKRLVLPLAFNNVNADGARFISTQQVKSRIKTVKNIQKITKAMKMVAASKLRHIQKNLQSALKFSEGNSRVLLGKPILPEATASKEAATAAAALNSFSPSTTKGTILAITSDRGLCGAINSSVTKMARNIVEESKEKQLNLVVLGEKGKVGLERQCRKYFRSTFTDTAKAKQISFMTTCIVADALLKTDFEECIFIYNHFKSVISYQTSVFKMPSLQTMMSDPASFLEYEFEGDRDAILQNLYEYFTAQVLYSLISDNATSEMSARMTAMDNSSTNARDMLGKLTLVFNKTRQAKITTELNEIISGALTV